MSMPRIAVLWFLLLAGSVFAQEDGPDRSAVVRHVLSFPDIRQQYVNVVSSFPASGDSLTFVIPSWTPGAYRIRNYSANVETISFQDAAGRPLVFEQIAKDAWRVELRGEPSLTVRYRVHAADLNVSASYVSPRFSLLNGAALFLFTDSSRDLPQRVEINSPPSGARIMTALLPSREGSGWRAENYDELVDSPIVIADANLSGFEQDGQDYQLAHVGDTSLWDTQAVAEDVRKIVEASNELWGELPFDRPYWIFNFLVEEQGGLEHDHSTVLMASRWAGRDRIDYIDWMSLVAHEYFHAWNIRRMRPQSLQRYDYRQEQYTSDLWLAEGITSYYDDLLLSRALVVDPAEYLKRLAQRFHTLELTPGRLKQSLDQTSFNAWIHQYQPDANSINITVSYYSKGAVLGFVLDTRIRRQTGGKKSLDDVMALMFQRWGKQAYPPGAFIAAVAEIAGKGVADWVQPLIYSTKEPDIDAALDFYGLVLNRGTASRNGTAGENLPAGLGINWSAEHGGLVVASVIEGLSGAEAGILAGDEVLAIDNERVNRGNIDIRKAGLRPGEEVVVLLSRHDRVFELPLTLGNARPLSFTVGVETEFTRRQLSRLSDWLGQDLYKSR